MRRIAKWKVEILIDIETVYEEKRKVRCLNVGDLKNVWISARELVVWMLYLERASVVYIFIAMATKTFFGVRPACSTTLKISERHFPSRDYQIHASSIFSETRITTGRKQPWRPLWIRSFLALCMDHLQSYPIPYARN